MPHSKLPKIKKGMVAEQIAIQFLLQKGFFVFKNFINSTLISNSMQDQKVKFYIFF